MMTESQAPLDFGSAHLRDLRVYLLRKVLERYGHGDLRTSPAPGREYALKAVAEESGGKLLSYACDVWSVPLGELARRAGVEQTVISSYVMGTRPMDWPQTKALSNALHDMVAERARKSP
jgi:hypothetical protein